MAHCVVQLQINTCELNIIINEYWCQNMFELSVSKKTFYFVDFWLNYDEPIKIMLVFIFARPKIQWQNDPKT